MEYWNKEKVSGPSISLANACFTMKTVINIGGGGGGILPTFYLNVYRCSLSLVENRIELKYFFKKILQY